jgi:uncharacterized membrane protein
VKMNPMLQAALTAMVRAILLMGSGWLVKHGVWSEGDAASYVAAAAVFIVSYGWDFWTTHNMLQILNTALMFARTTRSDVKAYVKNPATVTPTVTTPSNTVPGVPK